MHRSGIMNNDALSVRPDTVDAAAPDSTPSTPPKPPRCEVVVDNIPQELRARPQWVGWAYVFKTSPGGGGDWTKVPKCARGGSASTSDPNTWATFDDALAAYQQHADWAGIGYVFSADDPYAGIDLDDCIDERGRISNEARAIIDAFASYAEVSPSGTGVKIFIRGAMPGGGGRQFSKIDGRSLEGVSKIECYSQGRFFTVTGRQLHGSAAEIRDGQDALNRLVARCEATPKRTSNEASGKWKAADASKREDRSAHSWRSSSGLSDEEVIDRAGKASNGEKFQRLWRGDTSEYADDRSRADLALCGVLAFWTGRDPAQMDRLFRRSGLFRDKWDERRGARTYGQMTIEKAAAECQETYAPGRGAASLIVAGGGAEHESGEGGDLLVPLGQIDPATGRLVLSPRRTLPTAEAYVREFNQHADGRTLHDYGGLLMEWRGNRYCEVEEGWLKHGLQPWLHKALRYVTNKKTGEMELLDFESNPAAVKQALDSIRAHVHLPASTVSPTWLDSGKDRPPAIELLPCKSLNLHIPTGRVMAPTPALFNINALDFDYQPDPEPPERWIKFLEQLFEDDLESVQLLQEWMGYCLTGDTSQQKMLLLVGPRRSGKGTIGRIMRQLVGDGNVVGPTTGSLAGPFGLQPLIGKSLAIVSDARFGGDNIGTVVERLLCISGEDALTVDRKFLPPVSLKLPTRFMFLTNELPRLNDASTALAGRFLVLKLNRSFYGNEDVTLTDQLLAELPGMLHWAIEGWKRLRQRGKFVQPASAEDAIYDMEDLASPVGAFVREECEVGPGRRVEVGLLYQRWKWWCEQDGRTVVTHKTSFGRDLAAAVPGVTRRRGTQMVAFYEGIGLRDLPV